VVGLTILGRNASSLAYIFQLIRELVKRELQARYVGSAMGIFWSIIHPLVTLVIYTYVFSYILKVRFTEGGGTTSFALYLFCGLVPFLSFQETVNRCASSLTDNANFIKNLSFPTKALQFSIGLAATITQMIGLCIVCFAVIALEQKVPWRLPLVVPIAACLFLFSVGLGFVCARLHVYFRDTAQIVSVATHVWLYLTPIFYPSHVIPEELRTLQTFNPLAYAAESYRNVILRGSVPDPVSFIWFALICLAVFAVGYRVFTRGFGKVIDEL